MAKGNLILGTMSGKLGDIVAYTNNGKQCARVRRRVVRNPKSAGQQIQRMILNTASQFVSEMRPILNNGFEGVQKGAPSLAYARKLAMNRLRYENMYDTISGGFRYVARGKNYFAPSPLEVSKGSLLAGSYGLVGGEWKLQGDPATTAATLKSVFPWAEPGMQFTFVHGWIRDDGVATTRFTSFVFKDNETPIFIADPDGENSLRLNPAALDSTYTQGDISRLTFVDGSSVVVSLEGTSESIAYSAFIYSTRDGSKRSNAELVVDADSVPQDFVYDAPSVFPTYGAAAVDSGAPADYFLDNNPG